MPRSRPPSREPPAAPAGAAPNHRAAPTLGDHNLAGAGSSLLSYTIAPRVPAGAAGAAAAASGGGGAAAAGGGGSAGPSGPRRDRPSSAPVVPRLDLGDEIGISSRRSSANSLVLGLTTSENEFLRTAVRSQRIEP